MIGNTGQTRPQLSVNTPVSGIDSACVRIDSALGALTEALQHMKDRLGPVMRAEMASGEGGDAAVSLPKAPLEHFLDEKVENIESASRFVSALLSRLAL